jgi:hypothetical protein
VTIYKTNISSRLTSDIYPGDLGWAVNWDKPEERQEWYHNMSSVMQAGPCVRSNQLDYDEDVMYKVRIQRLKMRDPFDLCNPHLCVQRY